MTGLTLIPLALSTAFILWLSLGDPKRRRAEKLASGGHSPALRRALALGAMLPGIAIAACGDAAAFLIWLGGCAVIGWIVALALSQLARQPGD
ncbi:hypothetical protein [Sphingobium amiense]|nr:hypothetical protein [Sphingobium amiense]